MPSLHFSTQANPYDEFDSSDDEPEHEILSVPLTLNSSLKKIKHEGISTTTSTTFTRTTIASPITPITKAGICSSTHRPYLKLSNDNDMPCTSKPTSTSIPSKAFTSDKAIYVQSLRKRPCESFLLEDDHWPSQYPVLAASQSSPDLPKQSRKPAVLPMNPLPQQEPHRLQSPYHSGKSSSSLAMQSDSRARKDAIYDNTDTGVFQGYSSNVEMETVLCEERVTLLEAVFSELNAKKLTIEKELADAETYRIQISLKTNSLESQVAKLKETLTGQKKLYDKISASLITARNPVHRRIESDDV